MVTTETPKTPERTFVVDLDKKIQTIKNLRELTSCGLKEAKDVVDDLFNAIARVEASTRKAKEAEEKKKKLEDLAFMAKDLSAKGFSYTEAERAFRQGFWRTW